MASKKITIRYSSLLFRFQILLYVVETAFSITLPLESFERKNDKSEDETWSIVKRKDNQFVVNGEHFYINGFNAYWLMTQAVNTSTRGKVSEVFKEAALVGLAVCRTWGFSDGVSGLQKSPSVYDEHVFKALDFVVNEARKYKIRLILSLVNNWEHYGGKKQYVKWGNDSGLNLPSEDDFFTHPTIKGYFKNHIKTVLTRVNTLNNITYKDDPAIFAWELMNEPRCTSDPSGSNLQDWIQEMAFHVKSIDPFHLLEIGSEGFYGPSMPDRLPFNPDRYYGQVGADFMKNHQSLEIDFASVHIYPDSWLPPEKPPNEHIQFVKRWMQAHINDTEQLNMPVIFSEFGVSLEDGKFDQTFRETFIDTVYKTLMNSASRGGSAGGCLLWQLVLEGMEDMGDGYAIYLNKSPGIARMMHLQSKRMHMFNSKCSWSCRWSCRKSSYLDELLYHEEL